MKIPHQIIWVLLILLAVACGIAAQLKTDLQQEKERRTYIAEYLKDEIEVNKHIRDDLEELRRQNEEDTDSVMRTLELSVEAQCSPISTTFAVVALGHHALSSTVNSDCIFASGKNAARNLIVGNNDVIIGDSAGKNSIKGDHLVLLGDNTRTPTPTTSDFLNYQNKICADLKTYKQVPCPKVNP